MKTNLTLSTGVLVLLLTPAFSALADNVINDDLIVSGDGTSGSLCVGSNCINGEVFDFDTIRLKADDPLIRFQDTSVSAAFPTNDWAMGITDNSGAGPFYFYIQDANSASLMLLLEAGATGGVALGENSTLEANAISVGAESAERRIVNVAEGTDPTDGVNKAQFDTFTSETEAGLVDEKAAIDAELAAMQDQIDTMTSRIEDLLTQLEDL